MYSNSNKSIASNSKLNYFRKPSNSDKIISVKENEKPSQIVANNIIYNTPKIPNNYNLNASALPREESSINFNRLTDRDDSKLLRENKDLKEEIFSLKKKNLDKDKQLREKEEKIKELQERIHKLELENNRAKEKISKIQRNIRRPTDITNKTKTEDEELALALEKINEMETRRGINENNNNNNIFRNNHNRQNPFGFNIDPIDIININSSSSNRLFNEFFEGFGPNIDIRDNFLHAEEYHPLDEYERQIVEELCPNPDNMTYEQLLELQEQVGNVAKGFTRSELEKIPKFKFNKALYKNLEKCTVCQYDYNQNEVLRKLTCGHTYHKECIDEWLLNDKKCAICKTEVAIFK